MPCQVVPQKARRLNPEMDLSGLFFGRLKAGLFAYNATYDVLERLLFRRRGSLFTRVPGGKPASPGASALNVLGEKKQYLQKMGGLSVPFQNVAAAII